MTRKRWPKARKMDTFWNAFATCLAQIQMQIFSLFSKGPLMSLYSVFDAQTLPKRALLEYILIPFSGQTAYVKFVLSCGFWHVLGGLRVFQRLRFFLLFQSLPRRMHQWRHFINCVSILTRICCPFWIQLPRLRAHFGYLVSNIVLEGLPTPGAHHGGEK